MSNLKLKVTGQSINVLPWSGKSKQPWKDKYIRILIPHGFETKKGNLADIRIVKKTTISEELT